MSHAARGFALLVTVAAAACQGLPQQTSFSATAPLDASAREIRARAVQLGRLFSEEIERAADSIRAISDEPSIRRNALLWKMYAIPVAHEAVLLPEPALAILDAWAFALQMEEYFERGAGQNVFGPHQSIALDAVRRLDSATLEQALLVSDSTADPQRARNDVSAFVEQYPIQGPQFGRVSLRSESAALLGSDAATAVAAVGDINQAVGEITNRLAFHNEYLMKQVSWAALELLENLTQDTLVTGTLATATEALRNASALAEGLPSLVESERQVVIEALHSEIAVLLESIDVQRTATLAIFSDELQLLVEALVRERVIVGQGISAERVAVIDAIAPRVEEAIDYAFWRAIQLLVAAGLFAVLLIGIATFGLLRYSRSTGP
jgi:hypothetical protein